MTAANLVNGSDFVADRLGVRPLPGGQHVRMGTHNELLKIGQSLYLEVICIDPNAQTPDRARWFGLDTRAVNAPPQLINWVLRTESIKNALASATEPLGLATPMSRGAYDWLISITDDGQVPLDGVGPTLIEWRCPIHPTQNMPESGCQLVGFEIEHGDSNRIKKLVESLQVSGSLPISFLQGSQSRLKAYFETPRGLREL